MYNYVTRDEVTAISIELQAEKEQYRTAIKNNKSLVELKIILQRIRELEAVLKQLSPFLTDTF